MKLRGNILIVTQWSFKDALIQTYTLPYVEIIRKILPSQYRIVVVTAEQKKMALKQNEIVRINDQWAEKNMVLEAYPYSNFGWRKFRYVFEIVYKLTRLVKKHRIDVVHSFCMPAGGLAALASRITGKHLVLDSYEPHAHPMKETGVWKKGSLVYRVQLWLEKLQTRVASIIIGVSEGMKQYAKDTYDHEIRTDFYTKPACIDLEQFKPMPKDPKLLRDLNLENKIVMVYAGKLGDLYLKEEVFAFTKACYDFWGERFRFLFLTATTDETISSLCEQYSLPSHIVIKRFVPHHEVPSYMSLCDFGFSPIKAVPSRRFCAPIKTGEYWAMGLPVVITSNISVDSDIIKNENAGAILYSLNETAYRNAVIEIDKILNQDAGLLKRRIRGLADKHRSFRIAENVYQSIYGN